AKIPDQTVNEDEPFKPIPMDGVVSDKDNSKSDLRWEITGNKELMVEMDKIKGQIRIKQPRPDWNGKPEKISFTVTDPEGASATTSATYTVIPVNDPPSALSHSYTTKEGEKLVVGKDEGLLEGATDPDGDKPSEVAVVDRPVNGTLNLGRNGAFTYFPKKGFSGVDEFTFKVRDRQGGQSKPERVEINVQFKLGELRATPKDDEKKTDDSKTTSKTKKSSKKKK
ncbi:MAG TPA: Ig-like domain-containing protein, partial [Fibrobacteraceae bacterium]|nr:Ig-like domain-containing protein [Fibrobacteraceae bacterium]